MDPILLWLSASQNFYRSQIMKGGPRTQSLKHQNGALPCYEACRCQSKFQGIMEKASTTPCTKHHEEAFDIYAQIPVQIF